MNQPDQKRDAAALLLYLTFPDLESARLIGHNLLEKRLIAGITFIPGARSLYWWQGAIQDQAEIAAVAQTSEARFEAARALILRLHPYEIPCIVATRIRHGEPAFIKWIQKETETIAPESAL